MYDANQWDTAGNWPTWEPWYGDQRPKSPRKTRQPSNSQPRDPSRGRDQKGKGKGKGKGKSKGKNKAPAEEPAWKSEVVVPSSKKGATSPNLPSQPAQPTAEAAQLNKLLQALKATGEPFSPEVQEIMKEVDIGEYKASGKQLHNVVNQITDARRRMTETLTARSQLHQAWKSFLTDAVTRWESYMQDFVNQDETMAQNFLQAQQDWKTAKKNFRVTKRSLDGPIDMDDKDKEKNEEEEAQEISDIEEPEAKTDEDAKIKESITNMSTALQTIKAQAETIALESTQAVKKQRTDDGLGSASASVLGKRGNSMQPFGQAGR